MIGLTATLVAGCATSSHQVAQTNTDGSKVVTTDKTKQSDNAAMSVIGTTVKYIGDIATAVLPPVIPLIVGSLAHTAAPDPANAPQAAK